MFGLLFKLFGIAIGVVLIAYFAANAFRKARRLDARIQEFKEEQEALAKQGRTVNPYASLAELYAEQEPPPTRSKRRK